MCKQKISLLFNKQYFIRLPMEEEMPMIIKVKCSCCDMWQNGELLWGFHHACHSYVCKNCESKYACLCNSSSGCPPSYEHINFFEYTKRRRETKPHVSRHELYKCDSCPAYTSNRCQEKCFYFICELCEIKCLMCHQKKCKHCYCLCGDVITIPDVEYKTKPKNETSEIFVLCKICTVPFPHRLTVTCDLCKFPICLSCKKNCMTCGNAITCYNCNFKCRRCRPPRRRGISQIRTTTGIQLLNLNSTADIFAKEI